MNFAFVVYMGLFCLRSFVQSGETGLQGTGGVYSGCSRCSIA